MSFTNIASVLVRNGKAAELGLTKSELLKNYAGAYTTARTVDRRSVFEFSMHCTRLYDTATAVWTRQLEEAGSDAAAAKICAGARSFLSTQGAAGLKPLLRQEISTALESFGNLDELSEYQVTVFFTVDTVGPHTPEERGFDVYTYVQPMPPTAAMVDVQAHRADRDNPTIKDMQWIRAREGLEVLQKEAGVNEVLMFDKDGKVTEGLQTNFFAVAADGTLLTAPDDLILAGTVRKVVLEAAAKDGIAVRLESPNIRDLEQWESCFICSTSRLVKPISCVEVPELKAKKSFPIANSVAHRVEALVLEAFRHNAEPL